MVQVSRTSPKEPKASSIFFATSPTGDPAGMCQGTAALKCAGEACPALLTAPARRHGLPVEGVVLQGNTGRKLSHREHQDHCTTWRQRTASHPRLRCVVELWRGRAVVPGGKDQLRRRDSSGSAVSRAASASAKPHLLDVLAVLVSACNLLVEGVDIRPVVLAPVHLHGRLASHQTGDQCLCLWTALHHLTLEILGSRASRAYGGSSRVTALRGFKVPCTRR